MQSVLINVSRCLFDNWQHKKAWTGTINFQYQNTTFHRFVYKACCEEQLITCLPYDEKYESEYGPGCGRFKRRFLHTELFVTLESWFNIWFSLTWSFISTECPRMATWDGPDCWNYLIPSLLLPFNCFQNDHPQNVTFCLFEWRFT